MRIFLDWIPWLNEEDRHISRAILDSEGQILVVVIPTDEQVDENNYQML